MSSSTLPLPSLLRVLVVDDSVVCRSALRHVLESDPEIRVVGEAEDGAEALRLAERLRPSLITMDLNMPRMDGLDSIARIMSQCPTSIVVVTEEPRQAGVDMTFAALARGALDLLPKATSWRLGSPESRQLLVRLKEIVRAARTRPELFDAAPTRVAPMPRERVEVIGIGASTGGPTALATVLGGLPKNLQQAVVVVQHMDPLFHDSFVEWLGRNSALPVKDGIDGELLKPGEVRVGRPARDVEVGSGGRLHLVPGKPGALHSPSIDRLFASLAGNYGPTAVGVLLTGMGADGARGLKAMRDHGACTIAQDRESSAIYGMPAAAVQLGAATASLSPSEIAQWLVRLSPPAGLHPMDTANSSPLASPVPAMPRSKILLIDDSAVMLEAGKMALEDAGFEVITVDNPLTVPSLIRKERPDLILCDVNMPAVSGDVVAKIVGQNGLGKSPFVLYSDRPAVELQRLVERCGAGGFIQKTGNDEALVAEVRRFLEQAAR